MIKQSVSRNNSTFTEINKNQFLTEWKIDLVKISEFYESDKR
jgi:hypothetical protein